MLLKTISQIADVLIIAVWGGVFTFFVKRFIQRRKLVSLGIGAMSLGWTVMGLHDLMFPFQPFGLPMKLFALCVGCFVVYSIFRVERTGK